MALSKYMLKWHIEHQNTLLVSLDFAFVSSVALFLQLSFQLAKCCSNTSTAFNVFSGRNLTVPRHKYSTQRFLYVCSETIYRDIDDKIEHLCPIVILPMNCCVGFLFSYCDVHCVVSYIISLSMIIYVQDRISVYWVYEDFIE